MSQTLHSAAQSGDLQQVQTLLAGGADANATDADGSTALHLAAFNGHLEVVQALLAAGADVNAQDAQGWTPIFKAAHNAELDCGFAPIVQLLVDAGADVNHRIFYGLTPLMLAAGGGEAAVCEVLLNAGAEVKATNEGGRTALAMAKERFFVDVINLLHEAEGYVMETEAACPSGARPGPSDARVVNFIKRPAH